MPGIEDLYLKAAEEIRSSPSPTEQAPPTTQTPPPAQEPKAELPEELRSLIGDDPISFVTRHKTLAEEREALAKEKEELAKSVQERDQKIKMLDIRQSDEYKEQAEKPLSRSRETLIGLVGSEAKATEMAKVLSDPKLTDAEKGTKLRVLIQETGKEDLSYNDVTKALYAYFDANAQHTKFLQNWDNLKKSQQEKQALEAQAQHKSRISQFDEARKTIKTQVVADVSTLLADIGVSPDAIKASGDSWDAELGRINNGETPNIIEGAKLAVLGKLYLEMLPQIKELKAKAARLEELEKGRPGFNKGTSRAEERGGEGAKLGLDALRA